MKFRLILFLQLFFFSILRGETILYWNSSKSFSDSQVIELIQEISFSNPDFVCIKAENAALFEEVLSSLHAHQYLFDGLIVSSNNPITDFQFSPFSFTQAGEGILEFITADNRIYIPIFNDPKDQVLWEFTYQKIWDDYDPLSLLCTHSNRTNQLQPTNFICNSLDEAVIGGGPCSANLTMKDENGKIIMGIDGKISTKEGPNGGKVDVSAEGRVSRDSDGNVSKEARITVDITPGVK